MLTRNILFKLSIFFISLKSYAYKEFDLKLIHSEDFDHTLLDDTTEDGIDIIAHLTPDQYYNQPITMKKHNNSLMVVYGGVIKLYTIKGDKVVVKAKYKNPFFEREYAEYMQLEFYKSHWIIFNSGFFYKLDNKKTGLPGQEFTPIVRLNKKLKRPDSVKFHLSSQNKLFLIKGSRKIYELEFSNNFDKYNYKTYKIETGRIHTIRKNYLIYLSSDLKKIRTFNFDTGKYNSFPLEDLNIIGNLERLSKNKFKGMDISGGILKDSSKNSFLVDIKDEKPYLIFLSELKNKSHSRLESYKKFEKDFMWYKERTTYKSHSSHYVYTYDTNSKNFQILRKSKYKLPKNEELFYGDYYTESPGYLILLNLSGGIRIYKKNPGKPSKTQRTWEDLMRLKSFFK